MRSEQHSIRDSINLAEDDEDAAWSLSRAQWIEPAILPSKANEGDTVLYVYPTPSKRWNGMLYRGRLHISDIVGSASVDELKTAVRCRQYIPTAVKEFSDVASLRAEMARLGQLIAFE